MTKRENFIVLNGKRYDAYSGAILNGTARRADRPTHSSRSIDGIAGHHVQSRTHHTPVKTVVTPTASHPTKPITLKHISDIARPGAHHVSHHAPRKAQTLMRSAVKKPSNSLKRSVKVDSHTHALVAQPKIEIIPKLSHPKVDAQRARRANHVVQSNYIRRYASPVSPPVAAHKPVQAPAAVQPVHASTPAVHAVSSPAVSSMDIFERALREANSHLESYGKTSPRTRRKKHKEGKRVLVIASSSLSVLLIAGFIAVQNQANLTIRYASHKAGINATLPAYKPAGYSIGPFTYNSGSVAFKYTNKSSDQSFAVSQTSSGWDSQALRENFVTNTDPNFKTIESAGRTIYTFGKNNATWVNGGIWYQITSNGSLTSSELVNLASSM